MKKTIYKKVISLPLLLLLNVGSKHFGMSCIDSKTNQLIPVQCGKQRKCSWYPMVHLT
jgi:hypothetical protein